MKKTIMQNKSIGADAGLIWNLLAERGRLSIRQIGELSNFRTIRIGMALGWLARENKAQLIDQNGSIYVELSCYVSELYY